MAKVTNTMGRKRESTYDTVRSAFKDITTIPFSTAQNKKKNKKQQKKKSDGLTQALKLTTVEEYLACGYDYEQQDDHLSALIIYNQGLLSLTIGEDEDDDDESHPYFQLEKAKQNVLAILMKRIEGFRWSSFPNEVVSLIFESLELCDLFMCATVCPAWFEFIMDSPEFWKQLSEKIPAMTRSSLERLLRYQTENFQLQGPIVDVHAVEDLFLLMVKRPVAPVASSSSSTSSIDRHRFIRELSFEGIRMTDNAILLLEEALRPIAPTLKRAKIHNCDVSNNQVFEIMARSCFNATHISYSFMRISNTNASPTNDYFYPCFPDTPKKTWNTTFNNLTYLKVMPLPTILDFADSTHNQDLLAALEHLSRIIHRSPNLRELILDAGIKLSYGFNVALKHCPYIENIMLTCGEEVQPILTTTKLNDQEDNNNDEDIYEDVGTKTTMRAKSVAIEKGLRRLILVDPRGIHFGTQDKGENIGIFKKHHKTLEILYLRCDLHRKLFVELSSFGGPNLREINLSFLVDGGSRKECHNAMVMLFSRCPKLEVITIDSREPGRVYCTTRIHSLPGGSSEVLITIGENCPHLRHLTIRDEKFPLGSHAIESFISIAEERGNSSKLTYLEASINKQNMLQIVQQLKHLKTLRVPDDKPDLPEMHKYPEDHKEKAQQILSERGGELILDPFPTY